MESKWKTCSLQGFPSLLMDRGQEGSNTESVLPGQEVYVTEMKIIPGVDSEAPYLLVVPLINLLLTPRV